MIEIVKGKIKRVRSEKRLFSFVPEDSNKASFLIKYNVVYGCSYLESLVDKTVRFKIDYEKLVTTANGNFITPDEYTDVGYYIFNIVPEKNVMWPYIEYEAVAGLSAKIDEARNNLSAFLDGNPSADVVRHLDPNYATDNDDNYRENISDIYTDRVRLDYYLLKYSFSYAYLYFCMYSKLLREYIPQSTSKNLDVFSIGAGSRIDLAGLKYAGAVFRKREEKVSPRKIGYNFKYLSLDAADWEGLGATFYPSEGENVVSYIQDYLSSVDEIKSNVICFPYSMSELDDPLNFPDEETRPWNQLCQMLPGKLTSSDVFILTSLRSSTFDVDNSSFDRLVISMEENGFELVRNEVIDEEQTDVSIFSMDNLDGIFLGEVLDYDTNIEFMRTRIAEPYEMEALPICGSWIVKYRIAHFRKVEV